MDLNLEREKPTLYRGDSTIRIAEMKFEDIPNEFDPSQSSDVRYLRRMRKEIQNYVKVVDQLVKNVEIDENDKSIEDEMIFSTLISRRFRNVVRAAWPDIRGTLKHFAIDAVLNLVEETMTVRAGRECTPNQMLKAKDLLMLLARGFPPEQALLVMKDGYVCDFIKIGGNIATREEFIKRRKRLIGPQGLTLKTIEHLTQCYLYVYGNTVCIVGKGYDGINVVGEIILDCMRNTNPIYHIRRLVIMQELKKDPYIRSDEWKRFLPPKVKQKSRYQAALMKPRNIDFMKDDLSEMTYGRRIALKLMKYKWYHPQIESGDTDSDETIRIGGGTYGNIPFEIDETLDIGGADEFGQANLAKGWSFYEHTTLPRYLVTPQHIRQNSFIKKLVNIKRTPYDHAEPGDNTRATRLYSPFFTSLEEMGEFGLGVGLYFVTMKYMILMCLLSGIIHIPSMMYFRSNDYSPGKEPVASGFGLMESAICSDQKWTPCPTCLEADFYKHRYSETDDGLIFVKKTDCDMGDLYSLGIRSLVSMILLFIMVAVLDNACASMEIKFDEDDQTAQDYSIVVDNPPKDATDPDEWKKFFENVTGGHVTVCTIGINNDLLVSSLVQRREILKQLKSMLPPKTPLVLNNLAKIAAHVDQDRSSLKKMMISLGMTEDIASLYDKMNCVTSKIRGLSQIEYDVTKIYITFETEAAQRTALSLLSVGKRVIMSNNVKELKRKYVFRESTVLDVNEPEEPSTIRWQDLNATWFQQLRQKLFSYTVTLVCILVCVILVEFIRTTFGSTWAAYGISLTNTGFPIIASALNAVESHASESGRQASLFEKLLIFRWINTAIIIIFLTPFTAIVMDGSKHLIASVQSIFVAEIVSDNILKLLDISGNINRHIRAPRANTQSQMNKFFGGSPYNLAERYTNITKLLFLAFCYCPIYPMGMFMCLGALLIYYYTDSFSLMYSWTQSSKLGNAISELSRTMISFSLIFLSGFAYYFWSSFPFDNVCEIDAIVDDAYIGTHFVSNGNIRTEKVVVTNETIFVRYCLQDKLAGAREFLENTFPRNWARTDHTPDDDNIMVSFIEDDIVLKLSNGRNVWQTEKQGRLANIYGWFFVAFIAYFVLKYIVVAALRYALLYFRSDYEPSGEDQQIKFSNVEVISAYIPQVSSSKFIYPLIACDVKGIDEELYDWKDPENNYDHHCIIKDAEKIIGSNETNTVFSIVKYWRPY